MSKQGKLWGAAANISTNVPKGTGFAGTPKQPRSPGGKLIPLVLLYSVKFRERLYHATSRLKLDFATVEPLRDINELRDVLIEARKRLEAKNISSITATAWLGEAFQVIVERHPVIRDLKTWSAQLYVKAMNAHLQTKSSRAMTLNGHLSRVDVKKPFTKIHMIYDVRLKRPGQLKGQEFIDAGALASNADGQKLAMSMEIKTRGAGKELPQQKADFYRRLKESPPGTKMTYSIEGQSGQHEIDIKDIVLMLDRQGRPLEEGFFSRIGVIAGKRAIIKIAKDASGRQYIRVKLPGDTDIIRRVLERMLRDTSWQRDLK